MRKFIPSILPVREEQRILRTRWSRRQWQELTRVSPSSVKSNPWREILAFGYV